MDTEQTIGKVKQKRIRKSPYRRWSEQEQLELVNFLRDNTPIEKPTAQLYYKRFLHQIHSELDWTLVRCKVKNLRQSYIKAKSWQNSTGAGTLRDGETTKDVMERMCPLFDDLEDIFGYREYTSNTLILDTEESCTFDSSEPSPIEVDFHTAFNASEDSLCEENEALPETPRSTTKTVRKGVYSRTALADVLEVQSSLVEIKKGKLDMDYKIKEKELLLKEKEHELNKEKLAQELKCKEAEIQSQEKMKILELEMKERIALKELEIKERLEIEKLKMYIN